VYATWILIQSLGVWLTAPLVSAPEIETLRVALAALSESSPLHDGAQNEWEHLHRDFYRLRVFQFSGLISNLSSRSIIKFVHLR
jgi:hypothetical protein